MSMKFYTIVSLEDWNIIQKTGELTFTVPKDDEDYDFSWLIDQYVTRTGTTDDVKYVETSLYPNNRETCHEWYMADSQFVWVECEIPEGEFLSMIYDAPLMVKQKWWFSFSEAEWDALSAQYPHEVPPDDVLHATWVNFFDPNLADKVEKNWNCTELVTGTHKIKKDWVVDHFIFDGTNWAKWVGPNKVDTVAFPPLAVSNGEVKLGEKFLMTYRGGKVDPQEFILMGWEPDDLGDTTNVDCVRIYYRDLENTHNYECWLHSNDPYRILEKI